MSALAAVRVAIARAILGDAGDPPVPLGAITLRPHQADALQRLRAAIAEFGGALLADEPGLGKTFVALALAREYDATIVAAPAALRDMWRDAAARADVPMTFISLESLSRGECRARPSLVIVDEAHHCSNTATARFARLAALTTAARVLLLSATPVRNRRAELSAMLSLFLGPRAAALDEAARARCIIRREDRSGERPEIVGPVWMSATPSANVTRAIRALPPSLPVLDGREARALVTVNLLRCWSSSLAALDTALRRRLQRGAALDAILEAGRIPTRAELHAWVLGDDAVQLAFPLFVCTAAPDAPAWRQALAAHLRAVRALRDRISQCVQGDAVTRARILIGIRAKHPEVRIVAFTAFAATAEALYRELRLQPGVALLTARGARTVSGPRPRADILAALGPHSLHPARSVGDSITLVITTDVLSEGVNLQGAGAVIHLDLPWSPAALRQRVGRAARIGSVHRQVFEYGIAPPPAASRALSIHSLFARKRGESKDSARPSDDAERLRRAVASWNDPALTVPETPPEPVACHATRNGFLAIITDSSGARVVAGRPYRRGFVVSDRPRDLWSMITAASGECIAPSPAKVKAAHRALDRLLIARKASTAIGAGYASHQRRAVMRRADRAIVNSRPHEQIAVGALVMRLRSALAHAAGSGVERVLATLAFSPAPSERKWLISAVDEMEHPQYLRGAPRTATHLQVTTLLLLSCKSGGTAAARADGPRDRERRLRPSRVAAGRDARAYFLSSREADTLTFIPSVRSALGFVTMAIPSVIPARISMVAP